MKTKNLKLLLLLALSSVLVLNVSAQDPAIIEAQVTPAPAPIGMDANGLPLGEDSTQLRVKLLNNSSNAIPYSANNKVTVTMSMTRFFPNQNILPTGPGAVYFDWTHFGCTQNCFDTNPLNDVYTLVGVQNQVIPAGPSSPFDPPVGGDIIWVGDAMPTDQSEVTTSFGVGLNVNITATSTTDIFMNNNFAATYTATLPNDPEPIKLRSFDVEPVDNAGHLTWITESETNNSHFEIEYSLDGTDFIKIDRVNSKAVDGNSVQPISYTYEDQTGAIRGNYFYYRFKQVDIGGDFTYSPIRSIDFGGREIGTKFYPNPVVSGQDIKIESESVKSIALYTNDGKLLRQKNYDGTSRIANFSTSGIVSGVYVLIINGDEKQTVTIK